MGNAELQELVKAYAEGKVTFSDYRERRSELLDIITGHIVVKSDQIDDASDENCGEMRELTGHEGDSGKEEIISLVNNRSPVAFLLIVTIVLLSFVYVLTII